jgi:two-component system, NarL family, nitrate/nitrite response regulator NarL
VCSSRAAQAVRVLVANSNAIESELLAKAITRNRFIALSSKVTSTDIRLSVHEWCPDVLLLTPDLDDEPNGGLDLLADFRTSFPKLKIVVLLESRDPDIVVQSFRLGARGVFSKDLSIKVLGKCINCVQGGQIWATTQELGFVLDSLAIARAVQPLGPLHMHKLSVREMEIVNSLAEGLTNKEIARRLQLSKNTVRNYLVKIFHKLGASSRFELVSRTVKGAFPVQRWIPDENEMNQLSERRLSDRNGGSGGRPLPPSARPRAA